MFSGINPSGVILLLIALFALVWLFHFIMKKLR